MLGNNCFEGLKVLGKHNCPLQLEKTQYWERWKQQVVQSLEIQSIRHDGITCETYMG